MSTYLIVAKITHTVTVRRDNRQVSSEYLSNKCIEANTKKEAFVLFDNFISESGKEESNEKYIVDLKAIVLNIIEL